MSALPQVRAPETDVVSAPDSAAPMEAPAVERDNPVELLRDAIARLKSSDRGIPDQTEIANLLAEAREALERANVISHVIAQCERFLQETKFDQALGAVDEGLILYPADPVLMSRRGEVEKHRTAFYAAAAVRSAFEEASWFLEQDRADLAVQSLREKSAELPDQAELALRLEELENLLPLWEQKRDVQATLARAGALEQTQQWQAALTVLEEALQSYPASEELIAAAKRARDRMAQHERQRKLGRRVESISQKIAGHSWKQALTLLEQTQKEFPNALELKPLRRQVDAGLRRAESESIVTEVRQFLADGDLDQADQALRKGRKSLGPEPALETLRAELETERKYHENLRAAQVLFGRRQLQEAERILTDLAGQDRPEARALLDAVREARAATEEEKFFDRGREKALELMQQQQFAQAADLLRNLLSLFPGNPILERDLATAQSGLPAASERGTSVAEPAVEPEPAIAMQSLGNEHAAVVRDESPSRFRRAAMVGTASLVLVSAAGAAWKLSRNGAVPPSKPSAFPAAARPSTAAAAPAPEPAPPPVQVQAPANENATSHAKTLAAATRTAPLREFVPPVKPVSDHAQTPGLPLPPGTEAVITAETISALPVGFGGTENPLAPPPASAPQPADAAAARPVLPIAGKIQEAVLVSRPMPAYPELARSRSIFGTVRMNALVDEHGAVKNVTVVSGDPMLATAAKQAVLQWKYKPATLNGQPIATNATIQIVFGDRNK